MMNRIFKAEEIKAVRAAACARLILCAENAWKGGLMSRYYSKSDKHYIVRYCRLTEYRL